MLARLALVLLIGACSEKEAPPKPPTAYDEVAARVPVVAAAIKELDAAQKAAAGDCDKLIAVLHAFGDKHATMLRDFEARMRKLSNDDKARFQRELFTKLAGFDMIATSTAYRCQDNPAVLPALERAGFVRKPPTAEAEP